MLGLADPEHIDSMID